MPQARRTQNAEPNETTNAEAIDEATATTGRTRKNPNYKPPVKPEDRVVDVSDIPEDRPESADLATIIVRANDLFKQRAAVQESLQECRLLTSMMTKNGAGSREQVEWVRKYLPKKSRTDTNGEAAEAAE